MNSTWKSLGFVGLATVFILLWGSFSSNKGATISSLAPPPGFPLRATGLGEVETSFSGPFRVQLTPEIELDNPLVVNGHDPQPKNGGMALESPEVKSPDQGFSAEGKSAWIPLKEDGIALDTHRPWQIKDLELTLEAFGGGGAFSLRAPEAWLNARNGNASCPELFEANTRGVSIAGRGLELNASESVLSLGSKKETIIWEISGGNKSKWVGTTNGPGTLEAQEGGGQILSFPLGSECSISLPDDSGWGGNFTANGLILYLDQREFDLFPVRLEGLGSTRWEGRGQTLEGSGGVVEWNKDGTPATFFLDGPVKATDEEGGVSLQAATIHGLPGWKQKSLTLQGKITGSVPEGIIVAHSGSWQLGDIAHLYQATLKPNNRVLPEIRAMEISFPGSGQIIASGGAWAESRFFAKREWRFWSENLIVDNRREDPRIRAEGGVRFTAWDLDNSSSTPPLRYQAKAGRAEFPEAETVLLFGEPRVELVIEKKPAGDFQRGASPAHPTTSPTEFFRATAQRALLSNHRLLLSGEPTFSIPAKELGLAGDFAEIHAESIEILSSGAWEAQGPLRLTGAWQGTAHLARGAPAAGIEIVGGPTPCTISLTKDDQKQLALVGENVFVAANRVTLSGSSQSRVTSTWAEGEISLQASHLEIANNSGSARGSVSITSKNWAAAGDNAKWSGESPNMTLTLGGEASIDWQNVQASGQTLTLLEPSLSLEIEGSPATLMVKNDKTVQADHIVYGKKEGVIEAINVTLKRP